MRKALIAAAMLALAATHAHSQVPPGRPNGGKTDKPGEGQLSAKDQTIAQLRDTVDKQKKYIHALEQRVAALEAKESKPGGKANGQ